MAEEQLGGAGGAGDIIGTNGAWGNGPHVVSGGEGGGHGSTEIVGAGDYPPEWSPEFRAAADIVLERFNWAKQLGITFGGARDFYQVFGYDRVITFQQYQEAYQRDGLAGRIIDVFPNGTWRGSFELIEDDNPDKITTFEQAWLDLDKALQIQAKLLRVDKLSLLSTFAILLIGAEGELDQELPRSITPNNQQKLFYLAPFSGGGGPIAPGNVMNRAMAQADASINEFDTDPKSERFGLPKSYKLRRIDATSPELQKPIHWTRVHHVAYDTLDNDVYGRPMLERVWNLLTDLDKVTGGGAEAFWLRANQGLHLDIDKDMALSDVTATVTALKEQAESYKHQLTRWLRTRGVKAETLGSDVANFSSPADAIITQIAGSLGIPKRILTGSEMGELASSQDRENWKDQITGRQTQYAGPYIVRPLIDRLIKYGFLPTPESKNGYEVRWSHIQVLTEEEKVKGAQGWAQVNNTYGGVVYTDDEIRDKWSNMAPLTEEQLAKIEEERAKKQQEQADANAAATARLQQQQPQGQGFPRAAAGHEELVTVLADAIAVDNFPVVESIIRSLGKAE